MTISTAEDRPRTPGGPRPDTSPARRGGRRARPLPSGRALVGGFLVTVAMVSAVAVARSAGAPATIATLVARTAIAPGDALGPSNLEVVHLALPEGLSDRTFADIDVLSGTVARSFVDPGDLLQRGDVVAATAAQRAAAPAREVSIRLDADRAVDGRLEPGDRVDVLATYGTGTDATTHVVLADVSVLSADRGDGSAVGARTIVLTLALDDRSSTLALAHAVDTASVTVVRTTTAAADDSAVEPFRPGPVPRGAGDGSTADADDEAGYGGGER